MLIPLSSLRSDSHFPIQVALFAGSSDLLTRMRWLGEERGWVDDAVAVTPWADLDDWDKQHVERYDGFDLTMIDGYSVIISVADMYYYMDIASKIYAKSTPDAVPELKTILANYRKHFGLNENGTDSHA